MSIKRAARPGRTGGDNFDGSHGEIGQNPPKAQAEYRAGRFSLVRLQDMPEPKLRREIVDGLLAAGEVMLLTGMPKSGKSLLAAHLAAAVSTGGNFCGRPVREGRVVFLALERHALEQRRVIAAGADTARVFWTPSRDRIDLSDVEEIAQLGEAIRQADPVLVVVDTAAKAMPGLDENSSRDAGRAMAGIEILQDLIPGAAIVIVHHLDKGGAGPRGSGAILAAADLELRVERSNAGEHVRIARVTQANDLEEGQRLAFAIEDQDGEAVAVPCELPAQRASRSPMATANARRAAEAARRDGRIVPHLPQGWFTKAQAIDAALAVGIISPSSAAGGRSKTVGRVLDRLVRAGDLLMDGPDAFRVAEAGQAGRSTPKSTHVDGGAL